MSGCSKYRHRLNKAMEYNGIELPPNFIGTIAKRAKTDGQVDTIVWSLLNVLEPPRCQMSHCPSHTAYGFCGCSKSLVPGKCSIHKGYIKRQKEKHEKIKQQLITMIAEDEKKTVEYVTANFDFEKYLSHAGGISRVINYYKAHQKKRKS